jgi:hypothetical protein
VISKRPGFDPTKKGTDSTDYCCSEAFFSDVRFRERKEVAIRSRSLEDMNRMKQPETYILYFP